MHVNLKPVIEIRNESYQNCEKPELIKHFVQGIEEQLGEIYHKLDQGYLQYSVPSNNIVYWVAITIARLVMAKMTLFVYLPMLFSSPSEHFSSEIRNKLLIAAIEVAECNHALNAEQACRHWRWVFQTYTHWYATVYLLIEISRRPWSPVVERAWTALHSKWLIPAQPQNKDQQFWIPLRRLKAKARKHRDTELERLRSDPQAAERLESEDHQVRLPASPAPFLADSNGVERYIEHWRKLLAPSGAQNDIRMGQSAKAFTEPWKESTFVSQLTSSQPMYSTHDSASISSYEPNHFSTGGVNSGQPQASNTTSTDIQPGIATNDTNQSNLNFPITGTNWFTGPDFVPDLWPETDDPAVLSAYTPDPSTLDLDMNLSDEMDWYNWIQSAQQV